MQSLHLNLPVRRPAPCLCLLAPPPPWPADVVTARQFVLPKASSKAALIIEPRQHYGEWA
jgi:hypothetical protein